MTHTFVTLDVSRRTFEEIAEKLKAAGYEHAFIGEADSSRKMFLSQGLTIDMHGLGIVLERDDMPAGFVKPDDERRVFFYEQDFYVLSNFSAFSLEWKGLMFATSEQAYHWEKFPDHPTLRHLIHYSRSAHEGFKFAEAHKLARRRDWDDVKVGIMLEILRAKAAQHEYVRRKLLATGDRELIEDSWRDDFWGWGPNRDGKNMLGKLWMQVRAGLRDGPKAAETACSSH
jgi:ribA/ribD-fused uncharacterized protein